MRSSMGWGRLAVLVGLCAALALTGCIGSTGTSAELSASEGVGDLVLYIVVEDGQLVRSQAWWSQHAPEVSVGVDGTTEAYEAIVVKNDVVLSRTPMNGTAEHAVLTWRSSDAGTVAHAGDAFEVLVVEASTGSTVASYELDIAP